MTLPKLTTTSSSYSRVSSTWTNTASKLKVPDLPNLLSSKRDDWLRLLDKVAQTINLESSISRVIVMMTP